MRATTSRQAVVLLAGAIANLCSAVVVALVSQYGTVAAMAGNVFAVCSICLAFGNLFPLRIRGFENDGYKFCSLLFSSRAREEAVIRITLLERLQEFRQLYATGAFVEASESLGGLLLAFDRLPELSKQVEVKSRFANLKVLIDKAAIGASENASTDHTLSITVPDLDASSAVS
jgi:Zn-dependent protease